MCHVLVGLRVLVPYSNFGFLLLYELMGVHFFHTSKDLQAHLLKFLLPFLGLLAMARIFKSLRKKVVLSLNRNAP